ESIATRINEGQGKNFQGHHCKEKFRKLVQKYNAICEYINGSRTARRSRRSTSPAPSIEEVEQILSQRLSSRRNQSNQRSRRHSEPPHRNSSHLSNHHLMMSLLAINHQIVQIM
ncbi:19440_t:CDS:2, partial [Funneliformis geosporum]